MRIENKCAGVIFTSESISEEDKSKLRKEEIVVYDIFIKEFNKDEIIREIINVFEFPIEYRRYINWDSFEESLNDLSWIEGRKIAVFLYDSTRAWRDAYSEMSLLHNIIMMAALHHKRNGRDLIWFFVA